MVILISLLFYFLILTSFFGTAKKNFLEPDERNPMKEKQNETKGRSTLGLLVLTPKVLQGDFTNHRPLQRFSNSKCYLFLNIIFIIIHVYVQSVMCLEYWQDRLQCGNSQKFLRQIRKIFVALGLKILRLFRQNVVFEAYVDKGSC